MATMRSLVDDLEAPGGQERVRVVEVELELHGLFWFHTYAQPRDKYTHITLPVIHNYPLTLALLGLPVESSYVAVSNMITRSISMPDIWDRHGFYIYPAIARKSMMRTLTFSIGGTGYVAFKPKTRASVPDYTANQVFLPGSTFKTFILLKQGSRPPLPGVIRLGSKRYGVFRLGKKRSLVATVKEYDGAGSVTHPFNVEDCPARGYHGILHHYAGNIAYSGLPEKVIAAGNTILAAPSFITGGI